MPSPGATVFTLVARSCVAPVACGVATDPAPPGLWARWVEVVTVTGSSTAARAADRALLRAAISVSTASATCSPANRGSAASLDWTGRRPAAGVGPECPPSQPIARAPLESVAAARTTGEATAIRPTPGIARDSTVIRKSPIRIGPSLRPGDSNHRGSVESDWWSVAAELMWLNVARTYRTGECPRKRGTSVRHAALRCSASPTLSQNERSQPRMSASLTTSAGQANYPGRKSNRWPTKLFAKCGILVDLAFKPSRHAPLTQNASRCV